MNESFSGRRVLVVEDEMIVAWMLEDMLTTLGCAMIGPAVSIDQAMIMSQNEVALDAAILDLNLNGHKSYSVADALTLRGIPFILATGYNKDSLPNAYKDVPILQKPYRALELTKALTQILSPENIASTSKKNVSAAL